MWGVEVGQDETLPKGEEEVVSGIPPKRDLDVTGPILPAFRPDRKTWQFKPGPIPRIRPSAA